MSISSPAPPGAPPEAQEAPRQNAAEVTRQVDVGEAKEANPPTIR